MIPFRWCLADTAVCYEHHATPGGYSDPHAASSWSSPPVNAARPEALYLGTLDRVVERMHELFDQWEAQQVFSEAAPPDVMARARMVVHEWIANLVQHAEFGVAVPEIALSLWIDANGLHGRITDNSAGFDFDLEPAVTLEAVCRLLPARGMGLLMIHTYSDHLAYHRAPDGTNRLSFLLTPGT